MSVDELCYQPQCHQRQESDDDIAPGSRAVARGGARRVARDETRHGSVQVNHLRRLRHVHIQAITHGMVNHAVIGKHFLL